MLTSAAVSPRTAVRGPTVANAARWPLASLGKCNNSLCVSVWLKWSVFACKSCIIWCMYPLYIAVQISIVIVLSQCAKGPRASCSRHRPEDSLRAGHHVPTLMYREDPRYNIKHYVCGRLGVLVTSTPPPPPLVIKFLSLMPWVSEWSFDGAGLVWRSDSLRCTFLHCVYFHKYFQSSNQFPVYRRLHFCLS